MQTIDKQSRFDRKSILLGSSALMVAVVMSGAAQAQNCTDPGLRGGLRETSSLAAATASSIAAALGNVNTAFLTQQGSAFVSAPGNPQPWQPGGGVWVRDVGGRVDVKTESTTSVVRTPIVNPATDQGTINCSSDQRQTFVGMQVGQDISRLNIDGWNVHLGTTAGFLSSKSKELEGVFNSQTSIEVPFFGGYLAVTKGGFFADAMVRGEYYNIELNNPALNLHNQSLNARGVSATASLGYNQQLGNGWFVEPSAGFIWSRTTVDSMNFVGTPGNALSGTLSLNDVESRIGRASLRVGTAFAADRFVLQPFVTATVFHEFAGDVVSNQSTCPNCVFGDTGGGVIGPVSYALQTSSSRVGTYGQFSLGLAGQLVNTGWVGFARGDYRTGENIDGWTVSGGLRYQFAPDPVAAAVGKHPIYKAAPAPIVAAPVNWTGFYLGLYAGAAYGKSHQDFVGTTTAPEPHIGGYLGGGQIGYNYQINQFVLGVEGDVGKANIKGSTTCGTATGLDATGASVGFSPFFLDCGAKSDWVATLTGRLGYSWDRTLFYVKGGAAWADESVNAVCIAGPRNGIDRTCRNPAAAVINGYDVDGRVTGWVLGYGTEFALTPNWSAKAEYNYIRFGDRDIITADGTALSEHTTINVVKVGFNYRFSPAPVAVMAKY